MRSRSPHKVILIISETRIGRDDWERDQSRSQIATLVDAAEDGGAILFFDEADALFGKRSEVKDSHDRYANIEVNYLLQRMETYRGLAILATNMKAALDTAFLRRLRFIVNFPFPGPVERMAIWRKVRGRRGAALCQRKHEPQFFQHRMEGDMRSRSPHKVILGLSLIAVGMS